MSAAEEGLHQQQVARSSFLSSVSVLFSNPRHFQRMSSQKVLAGARGARPSPIRRQLKDDVSQDSLLTTTSLDKSDSMSSIPSIDMDREPQGEPEVKKVSKTKKVASKDSKTNGKTATPDSSVKDSVSVAKKKVKSTRESKADTSDDASSLRSRLKPAASRKGSASDDKSKSKSAADGKDAIPALKKLRPAPSRKSSDASKTPKETSIADDVCVIYVRLLTGVIIVNGHQNRSGANHSWTEKLVTLQPSIPPFKSGLRRAIHSVDLFS